MRPKCLSVVLCNSGNGELKTENYCSVVSAETTDDFLKIRRKLRKREEVVLLRLKDVRSVTMDSKIITNL